MHWAGYREDVRGVAGVNFWPYGLLAIRSSGHPAIQPSDHPAIWPSGHPAFWSSGYMVIQTSGHLIIRPSGYLVIQPYRLLIIWPSGLLSRCLKNVLIVGYTNLKFLTSSLYIWNFCLAKGAKHTEEHRVDVRRWLVFCGYNIRSLLPTRYDVSRARPSSSMFHRVLQILLRGI